MAKDRTRTGWMILYYHLTVDDLSDPYSRSHLPENGKRYEVELYNDKLEVIGTEFARYEEHFDIEGGRGQSLKNNSKWFITLPNGEDKEITDKVLRFRKIQ